jgi:cytochrome bd-type quinol oxidase subunit 2
VKLNFKAPFSVAIAMSFGIVVLFGYFFGINSVGELTLLGILRDYFLRGAVIMAAVALLVGIANLVSVHAKKIQENNGGGASFILILSLVITISVGIWDITRTYLFGELTYQRTRWIFNNIQLPIETSLMAVLAVSLAYAATRLLGRRTTVFSAIFVTVVLILLIGTVPHFATKYPLLGVLRDWIVQVPAVAGARGILFGVALGTIATGLRILMGSDRPYRS